MSSYIEIKSDKLLYWYSKLTGTKGNAKAGAFFPFIFTTTKIHPKMKEYFINHERIHFAQQIEKLLIGQWVFSFLETLYYRILKGKNAWDTYVQKACEQEAYDNMFNLEYLKNRKAFADLRKYLKDKPVSWSSLSKRNLQTEGFPIVYDWYDEPNTKYPPHKHQGKVSFYVLDGSVTFSGGINQTVSKGDQIDVPPQVEHYALVSKNGCRYIVGQEIEGDA